MKKKTFATISIWMATVMLIAGCGSSVPSESDLSDKPEDVNPASEEEVTADDDSNPADMQGENSSAAYLDELRKSLADNTESEASADAGYLSLYAPVFEEVFDVLDYGFNIDREYRYVSGALSDEVMYSGDDDLFDSIGYQLTDMTGDGIPELLIGSDAEYDDGTYSYIYMVDALQNDEPVSILTTGADSSYCSMGDGHLYFEGTLGASILMFGENHLNPYGEVIWDDFYFSDEKEDGGIGFFHNEEGLLEASRSEELDISEKDFNAKRIELSDRCVPIDWTPIGKYREIADSGSDTGSEENPYDGGPDWVSLADEFTLPTDRMCIEDAVEKYAITLFDGGRYHDYEGDIGDVIPEYKGRDLDGDHKPDVIKREGCHYVFELSRKGTFSTDDYSASPNEGEVIQFQDLGCRNFDEIEVVHYTFGTGGPTVWDTTVYSWQDGEWRDFPVIDKESVINSSELQKLITEETGKPYEAGSVRVADVRMQTLLLDLGSKDGPSQTFDYRTAYLRMNFFPEYLVEGDYECSGLDVDMSLLRNWPYDVTGAPVALKGDLQRKLNVFLSNFSEQNFEGSEWPYDYAHFVLEWCRINDPKSVEYADGRVRVGSDKTYELLDRYFGTNFEESDLYDLNIDNPYGGRVEYEGNKTWYSEPDGSGEMYRNNAFTVVTDAGEIEGKYDKFLRLNFKIYAVNTDEYDKNGISNKYYSLSAAEAEELASKGELGIRGEGLAYVEEVGTDRSKAGYWLIDMIISELMPGDYIVKGRTVN